MEGRDVNERDLAYLNKVRKVYLDLAEEKSWFVIDAERSVEQVHQDVFELVYDAFKKRRMVNP
jgi:thymidylate kinase